MSKTTLIIIGIIILCFGGLVTWSILSARENSVDLDLYDPAAIIPPNDHNGEIGDHVRGDANSPVIIVEYADFQCPGCATVHPKMTTLFEEYGDRVAFVFRHFPISGHQNARAASSAAISASFQDYFFEMAEILYANQAVWSYASGAERTSVFSDLFLQAAPTGDVAKFKADMSNPKISKKISFDYDLGLKKDKVGGTPSIFINGTQVNLSDDDFASDFLAAMRTAIDAQLSAHGL